MMSACRWSVLAALVAALVLLQHFGIEKTAEKREENVYTNIADLPPGDMVPTYVGSLFLGSFRAVAIDVFWIQLHDAQEARRWYLCREIAEILSKLQPHNEEVWAMIAWEFAYNVANGEAQRSEEKAWQWVRYGLLKLREGIRRNPRTPYLRYELARFLWHKPTWQVGRLDVGLLQRIENDDEIQRQIQDVDVVKERKSAFELAMRWYREAGGKIRERGGDELFYTTQMGLNLRPDTMDGFIRECMIAEAMYRWHLAMGSAESPEWDRAAEWFRKAAEHVESMQRVYGPRAIDEDFLELFTHMREILEAGREVARRLASGDEAAKTAARLRYVREMEALLRALGSCENGLVLEPLSAAKRDLSLETIRIGGRAYGFRDETEFNDTTPFATPLQSRVVRWGNFKPGPGDVDRYMVFLRGPDAHDTFEERTVTVGVKRIGQLPLRVRVYDPQGVLLESRDVGGTEGETSETFPFTARRPGGYTIDVRPIDEPAVLPPDTRYGIGAEFE
ncbi:MAG: hypothetical protein HYY17_17305 [Planctomycetes bacterium]|nr:hypothetical protein [Planctomycetota bacterium]